MDKRSMSSPCQTSSDGDGLVCDEVAVMTPINQSIVRSFVSPERVESFQQTNVRFGSEAVIHFRQPNVCF